MTKLTLDLTKSINENAAAYFERAKKIKKKIEGAEAALNENLEKLREKAKSKRMQKDYEENYPHAFQLESI